MLNRKRSSIVSANGNLYGWINNHNVDEVRKFLERGITAYRNNPSGSILLSQAQVNEKFSMAPDPKTSVVRVFTRVRPVPAGADDLNNGVGRDHFLILQNEVEQIYAHEHDDGKPFLLPSPVVARLVRYHLIDNVRGEPGSFGSLGIQRWLLKAGAVILPIAVVNN